jgi:hypothetical protein
MRRRDFLKHMAIATAAASASPIGTFGFGQERLEPEKPDDYIAAYDMDVNPTDEVQMQLWSDLAAQTNTTLTKTSRNDLCTLRN